MDVGCVESGKGGQEAVDAFGVDVHAPKIEDVVFFCPGCFKTDLIDAVIDEVKLRVGCAFFKLAHDCGRDGLDVGMKAQGALFGFAGNVAQQGIFCDGVIAHEMRKFEEAVAPFFTGYEEGGKGRELMHPQVGVCAGDFAGGIVGKAHSAQEIRAVCSHATDVYAFSSFFFEGVGIRA